AEPTSAVFAPTEVWVICRGAGANAWGMLGEMTLQQWLWALAWLALFVLYHLPSGQLLSRCGLTRDGGRTFQDPRFLALAAALGLACSGVYLASGSLWAAVAVHWLPVCLWLLFLGGEQRLRGEGYEDAQKRRPLLAQRWRQSLGTRLVALLTP
ncbi:unnamed protein product, partial [Effrenium voratum]